MKKPFKFVFPLILVFAMLSFQLSICQSVFSPKDLLSIERCKIHQLSPYGTELIYSISTPRGANFKPGQAHTKYLKMKLKSK